MNPAALLLSLRRRGVRLWREAFVAINTQVISAEEIFLPWLVGSDGMTVAEALLPRLKELPKASVQKLLRVGS